MGVEQMTTTKKNSKKSYKTIFIMLLISIAVGFYYSETKDDNDDKFAIKTAGETGGYRASFINRTGKDVEDKKIRLSDDYWLSGKFGF